jgi:transcriptional regulator with XRE-family HTH domain
VYNRIGLFKLTGVEILMEELDIEIGKKLKEIRMKRGYTLKEVAEYVGIDFSYVSKIEKGQFPSLNKLNKMCEMYGITVPSLFGNEVEVPKELKELGVKWVTLSDQLKESGLSLEDLQKAIPFLQSIKKSTTEDK